MNRRDFIKLGVVGTGAAIAGVESLPGEDAPAKSTAAMVGMPICVAPLAQHELDPIFEDMQKRAGVNALFPFIYSHEPHRAGVPPSPRFHGGNYAMPNMQYYKGIPLTLEDMHAPEFGGVDVLARIIPAAQKHGIRVFCFVLEDNQLPSLVAPHWEPLYEVDHHGRRTTGHPGGPCFNNPLYQAFALGLVEDYARSYDIGGIMWGSERQSGLLNTLGLSQSSGLDVSRTTCFCEFCLKKGRDRGIDVERARLGYDAAETFVRNSRSRRAPRDGCFTEFWRLLMKYPEALAWENLWVASRHEFKAALCRQLKSVNPSLLFGWHIWQNMSFSPFQRAEEDYGVLAENCDFLRPAFYNNVAGGRFLSFVKGANESIFGDLPPEETLDVLYHQLNYREAPYDKLLATGLSAEYVKRETRRAVEGVAGHPVQIWPGVDIDVPAEPGEGHCTPESVGEAVKAVFKGGAEGIILSRNYIEMKPTNLSGAGAALRELGII
ncbi:MAG TPA: hypothetical protein VGJ73_22235 [Verrucomicrobiae bacterium]